MPSGNHDFLLEYGHAGSGTVGHDICLALTNLGVGTCRDPGFAPRFLGKTCRKQEEYESVLFHAVAFIMLSSEGKSFLEEESDVLFQVKYSSIAFPVSDMRFRSCRLTQMSEVAEDSEKVRKFCSTSAPLSIGRFKHIAKKRSVT